MKLFGKVLIVFMLFLSTQVFAQTEKGHVKMEVTDVQAEDPAIQAQVGMLKGTTTELYFDESKNLTVTEMMGGMVKTSTLVNISDKSGFMLFDMDMMGQKIKIDLSEEIKKAQESDNNENNIDIEYFPEDTKDILGYKTYKAIMKQSVGDQESEVTFYITEDIKTNASPIQGVDGELLKGFPLEYSIKAPGMVLTYSAVEFNKDFEESEFELSTAGYEEMTMEEFQKKMGGMNMGF